MPAVPVRVLLADDHPMLRAGIRGLLDPEPDIVCVGEAGDGAQALRMALAEAPDIVILDMLMPFLDGVAVARRLREAGSACKIVAMTAREEAVWLDRLLELGMRGYVLKRSAADDLLRAIRAVAAGGTWFDPAVASLVVEAAERRAQRRQSPDGTGLSERESEVLRMTAQGHGNKAIALALRVGVRSIETYKTRAMAKLGLAGRVGLIAHAVALGWIGKDRAGSLDVSGQVRTGE